MVNIWKLNDGVRKSRDKRRRRVSKRRQKSGTISQFPGVRDRAHSDATTVAGSASLVCWANGRCAHSRGPLRMSWPVVSGRSFWS